MHAPLSKALKKRKNATGSPTQISLSLNLKSIPRNDLFHPRLLQLHPDPPLQRTLHLRPPIQETQIRLPPNRNHAREYAPVLGIDKRKAERRDRGPEFATVLYGGGHRALYSFPYVGQGVAREEGLHAEEVGVEERGEHELVDHDFGEEGEEFGGVVEVVSEE